jgi:TonB family protein
MVTQPSFSEEDQQKWKRKSVQGRIAIVIDEAGDVTEAHVIAASPKGVEDALIDAAKRAKFQPRKGCGELKTDIFFNLH